MSERVRVGSCVKLPDGVADIYRGVASWRRDFRTGLLRPTATWSARSAR